MLLSLMQRIKVCSLLFWKGRVFGNRILRQSWKKIMKMTKVRQGFFYMYERMEQMEDAQKILEISSVTQTAFEPVSDEWLTS